jgi:hypothetical protein
VIRRFAATEFTVASKYIIFQLAEVAVPHQLFTAILNRIERLRLACASG